MRRTCSLVLGLAIGVLAFFPLSRTASAALVPAGPEFNPSVSTSPQLAGQWLVRFADGGFLVAWRITFGPTQLMARVFDAEGTPAGSEFVLSGSGTWSGFDLMVVPPGDRFVLVQTNDDSDANWRLFDESGGALGAEVAIDDGSELYRNPYVGMGMDGAGQLVVLQQAVTDCPSSCASETSLQRFLLDGTVVGAPVVVLEDIAADDETVEAVALAAASDGTVAVAWVHYDLVDDPGSDEIHAYPVGWVRRYDSGGSPVGSDFQFAAPTSYGWLYAGMRADGTGRLYFPTEFYDGAVSSEIAHSLVRFNLNGTGRLDLTLPPHTFFDGIGAMATSADGRLAISWAGTPTDGYEASDFLQRYAADGSLDGDSLAVADRLVLNGGARALLLDSAGSAVAVMFGRDYPGVDGTRVRRYCDSGDTACTLCPAFDDGVDSDADGAPDGCDPCNNVAGQQDAGRASSYLSYSGYVVEDAPSAFWHPLSENEVRVSQHFVLPFGTSFDDLPVLQDGMRLRIESVRGDAMVDVQAPGGTYAGKGTAGWTLRASKKFTFRDRSGSPVNGLRKITISNLDSSEPGGVKVLLRAAGGRYASREGLIPMRSILVLGGTSASVSGICSEADFRLEDCNDGWYPFVPWARCARL